MIQEVLRDEIVRGELPPYTKLREPALAERLQVSRTPLREALRHLESEGFVERVPSGGVMVAGIDLRDIRDLFGVRAVLEANIALEVAERASQQELEMLDELLDRMEQLTEIRDQFIRLGLDFHDRLAAVAGNERTRGVLRQLRSHVDRYWAITTDERPQRIPQVEVEHRKIVAAMHRRDLAGAETAMRAHIWAGAAICIEAVGSAMRAPD
ncbi:MAG: GntR family transcriptional regulator [Candidatus Dormiibacterota bacterium]